MHAQPCLGFLSLYNSKVSALSLPQHVFNDMLTLSTPGTFLCFYFALCVAFLLSGSFSLALFSLDPCPIWLLSWPSPGSLLGLLLPGLFLSVLFVALLLIKGGNAEEGR